MAFCPACGTQLPIDGGFCPSCGTSQTGRGPASATNATDDATIDYRPGRQEASSKRVASGSSQQSSGLGNLLSEGRFLPGKLVAGRYRIIALLGRGGMGEVYRADDLTLGQAVALKFLPEEATNDAGLLERFKNEVRIARRVSHPNVCRVYDVGEVDGATFFTMEYVDGEDLASLLRRIGRLPPDKALEIARQMCAGLAAAHAKGVLHRDLKPANIMLDGRGQVVVTDFGLAGLAEQIQGAEIRSGTPAYMAPEQFEGRQVSVQSDIYSLGLVLFEVFTGKRAFSEETLPSARTSNAASTTTRQTTLAKDFDPAVERVILRCLEAEPSNRPTSVMQVAAALPGGDPLAAALAAGETPSPQMVAAAGETSGLSRRTALLWLASAAICLLAGFLLSMRESGLEEMGLDQPPAALEFKARDLLHHLGYADRPADYASDFFYDTDYLHSLVKNKQPVHWDALMREQPSVLKFWYRQSPQNMLPLSFRDQMLTPGRIARDDPPQDVSNMVTVDLDAHGRLVKFAAQPPQKEEGPSNVPPVDWSILFEAADLKVADFKTAEPQWAPLAASDQRVAWTGTWPGSDRPLRVEAAAFHGKPIFFLLAGPWTNPERMQQAETNAGSRVAQTILLTLSGIILVVALMLARRNYRLGRGDKEGATRLAAVIFATEFLLWLFRGHFVADTEMTLQFILAVSTALFWAGLTFVMYLALEPYIRRHWPQSIISWSRLLTGRVRDPIVGRDVLYGVTLGAVWIVIFRVAGLLTMRLGDSGSLPATDFLNGYRETIGAVLGHVPASIQATLMFFFIVLLLRIVLRNPWLAGAAFVLLWVVIKTVGSDYKVVDVPAAILVYGIAMIVVIRFGLLALAIGIFLADLLGSLPSTLDFSIWYAPDVAFVMLLIFALLGWGFYESLGGKPLFGEGWLE